MMFNFKKACVYCLCISLQVRISAVQPAVTDVCAGSSCQNGATCSSLGGGFMCHCAPGFFGYSCEKSVAGPIFLTRAPTTTESTTGPPTTTPTTVPTTTTTTTTTLTPTPPTTSSTKSVSTPPLTSSSTPLSSSSSLSISSTTSSSSTSLATAAPRFEDDTWSIVWASAGSFLIFAAIVFVVVLLCEKAKRRRTAVKDFRFI